MKNVSDNVIDLFLFCKPRFSNGDDNRGPCVMSGSRQWWILSSRPSNRLCQMCQYTGGNFSLITKSNLE